MKKQKIIIQNKLGLHARASAKLVAEAAKYLSHIEVVRNNKNVNGKSIMGVMMLAASKGTEIEIITEGQDENEALEGIIALINNKFDEKE